MQRSAAKIAMTGNRRGVRSTYRHGDLRRALLENEGVIHTTVAHFMTANPHTIKDDAQLSEAEAYMLDNKIRALAVTNSENAVVGVVEIFD